MKVNNVMNEEKHETFKHYWLCDVIFRLVFHRHVYHSIVCKEAGGGMQSSGDIMLYYYLCLITDAPYEPTCLTMDAF